MGAANRRLTLSPIGFDVILALSQAGAGLRLAEISHVIGSPVSSVQSALRVLITNDLVRRVGDGAPRYLLATDHPAGSSLVKTAAVIGEPAHAIALVLRANPGVTWAGVDEAGFLVGLTPDAPAETVERLERQLQAVSRARPDSPAVAAMPMPELDRLARVALELRARVRKAVTIKGRPPAGPGTVPREASQRAG